ncbi:sensor histidine kinase [Actinophytocola sp.]|uniref:sensor histidine kinase n=1 Tax=Actinophytocola sp. TaxID=1872138 RepID=UPI002D8010E0|nr:ATP-binding protein [Actinophytocola sp.]HET9139390.1 ATP-binding protein [Actinophytocola sp.]
MARAHWRRALARRLDPQRPEEPAPRPADPEPPPPDDTAVALAALSEQFAIRILTATYQMGTRLEAVEADEQDPARLEQLYGLDHVVSRVRRQAENLLVLAGRQIEDAGRQTTTMLDVVRAASSAIEFYARVQIGHMIQLGVFEYAADDVIRVLNELLDNATRFSPPHSTVVVAAHLTESGSVLLRVEDVGFGLEPQYVAAINAMLASTVPMATAGTATSGLGLVVVQRLVLAHRLRVQLTVRPSGGTTAMVLVPPELLCEIARAGAPDFDSVAMPQATRTSPPLATAPVSAAATWPANAAPANAAPANAPPANAAPGTDVPATVNGLPVRRPASLRDILLAADVGPTPPPSPDPSRPAWADDAADFAAGIVDARRPPIEGSSS